MVQLLGDEPVLTLFVVVLLGALLGRVRVRGVGLGVAATVFAGLAVSAAVPAAALPGVVTELGLALFVFTVGLASGPTLRVALRGSGRTLLLLGGLLLVVGAVVALAAALLLGLAVPEAVGVYAGALTNAPTLAVVVEQLGADGDRAVVAFAVAYPVGMAATLVTTSVVMARSPVPDADGLQRVTARVEVDVHDVDELLEGLDGVEVVRVDRGGRTVVAQARTHLRHGDVVTVLGASEAVETVVERLGGPVQADAFRDRDALDFRPVMVTRRDVAGRPLADLELRSRHGARITRVARGDLEWLAHDGTVLELGDRVTLVAPPDRLDAAASDLGDDAGRTGELDLLTVGLGLALGLALGAVELPLAGLRLQLGFAGGPLVAGLVLGALVRTGPLLWQVPQQAGATLRQVGLALFLAGVGTSAGPAFVEALGSPEAVRWAVAALLIVAAPLVGTLVLRRRFLDAVGDTRDGAAALGAALAGATTQPAALALVDERGPSREDLLGYATLFPLGMVGKVLVAQLLAAVL